MSRLYTVLQVIYEVLKGRISGQSKESRLRQLVSFMSQPLTWSSLLAVLNEIQSASVIIIPAAAAPSLLFQIGEK